MSARRITEIRYCRLRDMEVRVLVEESRAGLGDSRVERVEKKCLDMKKPICLEKGCSFTQLSGRDPFGESSS